MRIETKEIIPLSPAISSNSSADEMMENENQTVRDRVVDLEKKVHDQNDEILCLKSTLADALRRITSLEGTKYMNNGGRSTPIKDGIHSRVRSGPSSEYKRGSDSRGSSTPTSARGIRRVLHYQSTSSLYSDGHSSSSASPAPSPSPTGGPSNHVHNHNHHHGKLSYQPATNTVAKVLAGPLNKRWASTSDFSSPNGNSSSSGYPAPNPAIVINKRVNTGSLHNLTSTLRASNPSLLIRQGKDAQYNAEEGAVKFYLRGRPLTLYVPTHLKATYSPQKPSEPPQAKLKLEWVYGYRGRDCRNNVYQLPTGEIVYFVAAAVVLYNVEEQSQRHYLGHTDDIKCLAVHPNKLIIATGQTAGHDRRDARSWRLNSPTDPFSPEAEEWPHIRIWDSVSLATLHIIGISDIEKSVSCLAFSRADGGGLLVVVDEAPDHNMSVWDWSQGERGYKLMETKCAADQVLSVDFSPVDRNTIITCGKNQIAFWVYDNGMLAKRVGIFENRERPKYVTAISFLDTANVVSGDTNGNLLIWQRGGNRVEKSIRGAHDGAIFSILVQKDGSIITGGKDGVIIEWDRDLRRTGRQMIVPEHFGSPRVVTSGRGSRLVIGTTRNCILGGTFTLPLQPLMQSHTDELWALTPHPCQNQFLTAGYDKCCYLWDSMSKSIVWSKDIGEHIQSTTFSINGEVIVVGLITGKWFVIDSETREIYSQYQDGSEPIQVVKFSPNGKYLALASRDNNIYMYQISEGFRKYTRFGRCQGHSSFVSHIDWSSDSTILRSNSGDYELLFWTAASCRQVAQTSSTRDITWASQSCSISFATLGIWPEGAEGTDISSCCKAGKYDLIATGDDFGKVKLFVSPACQQKAKFTEATGHSSHVTCVEFLHNDTRLISIGGRDTAVMQWMVNHTR